MIRTFAMITSAAAAIAMMAAQQAQAAPQKRSAAPVHNVARQNTGGTKSPAANRTFTGNKNFTGNKGAGNKTFTGNKGGTGNKAFTGNKGGTGNKAFTGNKGGTGNKAFTGNKGGTGNKAFTGNKGGTGNKNFTGNNNNFKGKANFQGGGGAFKGNAVNFKAGPGPVNKVAFKPAPHVQFVKLGKYNAPLWKAGPKKIWWGNKWKVFVPLTALGVVALGGAYYYPDAYLTVARPVCTGITPDGCRLNWQRVDFEDGEGDWQCVQYCRRPGGAPPPRTVALVAPPPMAQGGACELSIFSEPNFAGTNATANDEQPRLGEIGWQNQIASVKVAAGTWDFFSDPEFTGETMRLPPGEYGDLGAEWSRKAGSFMCVQP